MDRPADIPSHIHMCHFKLVQTRSLYENRKMEWNLSEMDQDAEQLMDILKLKPFFHKMVGIIKK